MDDMSSDDCDMECDFIHRPNTARPNTPPSNSDHVEIDSERAMTPPNNGSLINADFSITPLYNTDSDPEPSFIKRVGFDKNHLNKNRPRCTSTPLFMNRLSNTLPNCNLPAHLGHLSVIRQCKSTEIFRTVKFGPEQLNGFINPFTRDGKLMTSRANAQKRLKRLSIDSVKKLDVSDSLESDGQSNTDSEMDFPIRPRLSEFNVSRFNEEFVELKEIGKGVHGCVYKCLNLMNGCMYAVKRTIKPIKSSLQERIIRNEIYAHGVLDHQNIVRNYSCWKEEGFVFIQNEFCNGGSLEEYIKTNVMSEALLRSLLLQMAHALRYIHNKGLAHMDIKPGNVLLSIDSNNESSLDSDGGFSDDEKNDDIIFKLGDLGHITRLDEENDVEEGDCRYLPREILEENYNYLDRADIFALGLTVYEAAGGGPLPKNGDEWQEIRNGNLKNLDQHSKEFNCILKAMVQPAPEKRPSAPELIPMVKPNPPSPRPEDLVSYLQHYQRNNTRLEHKVEATGQYLRVLYKSHKQLQDKLINGNEKAGPSGKEKTLSAGKKKGGVTKTRIVGRRTTRSSSTMF